MLMSQKNFVCAEIKISMRFNQNVQCEPFPSKTKIVQVLWYFFITQGKVVLLILITFNAYDLD